MATAACCSIRVSAVKHHILQPSFYHHRDFWTHATMSSASEDSSLEIQHEPSSTAISILDTSPSKTLIAIANRVNSSRKPTNQQVTCPVRAGRGESCEELLGECCSQHLLWQHSEVGAPDCSWITGLLACSETLTRWSSVTGAYFRHTITRPMYLSRKFYYQHPCAGGVYADHRGHRKRRTVTLL